MLSVRSSPSSSVFENPNPNLRKRYIDGSHKGFERSLIDAYGRDPRVRVSDFESQPERNPYLGSRCPQQPSWNKPSQPSSQSSQNLLNAKRLCSNLQTPFVETSLPSVGSRPPRPNVHSTSALQSHMNQGPSISRAGFQSVMPVMQVGLRPPVNVQSSFTLQNQINNCIGENQGPYIPNDPLHSLQNSGPVVSNKQPSVSPYSGLLSSLLVQGVISLPNKTPHQDSLVVDSKAGPEHGPLGVELDPELLNARNESAISSLYKNRAPPLSEVQNSGPSLPKNLPDIGVYSGLLSSLLAQGAISLPNKTPRHDSLVVESKAGPQHGPLGVVFKPELLNPRNESVISSLYKNCAPPLSEVQNSGPSLPKNQPEIGAYSGLLSSLVAQGVISLPKQESLGVVFNPELLKVRHESVIRSLYSDIPRQCTTCGHRFKCQEEHRRHMDWHVVKNRMSKTQTKKKQMRSRMWFVDTTLWLSASSADAAGPKFKTEAIVVKKKTDEETAVPADEDKTSCALCGEAFNDFYSQVTDDWMYKDAAYLNAPDLRSPEGRDRSELGPIVHKACISDGSLRKRLRRSKLVPRN